MCNAKPGKRCADHAFKVLQAAKEAYAAAPPGTLARGQAAVELKLARADYAATFKASNPELWACARRLRGEQTALMPDKPAINEPGTTEWLALADARDRLASVQTAMFDDELRGIITYDNGQVLYEDAVMRVARAEQAFKAIAWQHYDVEPLARDALLDARAGGDDRKIKRAEAVYYLATHHDWPQQAQARYEAAHAANSEQLLDATWEEREHVRYAQAELPKLAVAASPHTSLVREGPGETMPPAPWVKNPTRPVDPADTPQVRWLCEGASSGTRFDRETSSIQVRDPSAVALKRLWAYGYRTEPTATPRVLCVSQAADLRPAGGRSKAVTVA